MLIVNTDAARHGGLGVTIRDAAGVLLAAYSYQVWGSDLNSNALECLALLEGLALVPDEATVHTDSTYAVNWYQSGARVSTIPHVLALRSRLYHTYTHIKTTVSHVSRNTPTQQYADFVARFKGQHTWVTPAELAELDALYSADQLSRTIRLTSLKTRLHLSDTP